ncbi:MAG: exodeoxyribonuclease VII small subunit [Saprospiraceae bacterium]|nr:exodeoxyribonuclease VII small subunit [Lewinellaceae bacterium]
MKKDKEPMTYESAYAELQQIVADLQSESIGIDVMAGKIARAQELIEFCRNKLRETEEATGKLI